MSSTHRKGLFKNFKGKTALAREILLSTLTMVCRAIKAKSIEEKFNMNPAFFLFSEKGPIGN